MTLPASAEFVRGSSHGPAATAPSGTKAEWKGKTVLIDNYDSFTYNIVEFLSELGTDLIVFRNDKVTLEEIKALEPARIVISPGPGHPLTDSGISIECIKHYAGKLPIMGVCMGLQCIYAAYTGVVEFAGEILHGKTSLVRHDAKGLYAGLSQDAVVGTRYHSLAAQITTLPAELVVTSKTDSGVVMGIRHTRFALEAVQFHPESILSTGGKEMMRNFLTWQSGTWEGCPQAGIDATASANAESTSAPVMAMKHAIPGFAAKSGSAPGPSKVETILERIHVQRLKDIEATKAQPGFSQRDLDIALAMHLAPPQISFPARLTRNASRGLIGVMAEMKRASPSKGNIDLNAHAGAQAAAYARGGASVISVLTEPTWFKGTLQDLVLARRAIDAMEDRPAILRKDFIIDTYQIAEARLAGADTVLLIVAMLSDEHLRTLYDYSCALGMEPLVEVNNPAEMQRAVKLGAKVIGVNNRNLHDFKVDMETTSRVASAAEEAGVILCALSGITGRADVVKYQAQGVAAVLVGEALMRSPDKKHFIDGLLGIAEQSSAATSPERALVKICGIQTPEAALTAVEAGADMLGMILAPNTKRTVSLSQASAIIEAVRTAKKGRSLPSAQLSTNTADIAQPWFVTQAERLQDSTNLPLLVGVFRDQPLSEVKQVADQLGLDVVQLHGHIEEVEWARFLPGVLVIKVFSVPTEGNALSGQLREALRPGLHHIAALDTASAKGNGGTGESFDWAIASTLANHDPVAEAVPGTTHLKQPIMLAGGLTAENVADAITLARPRIVDTSSGVETEGKKDSTKILNFVRAAKAA